MSLPPFAVSDQKVDLRGRRVWVAGHRGMVGAALVRRLAREDVTILTASRTQLDLRRQSETEKWFAEHRPEIVFMAAAKVGGILANDTFSGQFLYDNIMMQSNVVEAARLNGATKVMLLGSSCIYPRLADQPIVESSLLSGPLEETNQWYAVSKIAGLKLGQAYRREYNMNVISVMPTNLYGQNDDYDRRNSHVAAALLRRIHEAKTSESDHVVIWGTGSPRREFLHVDDLADACVFLMKTWEDAEVINIGSGQEVSITELASLIADIIDWRGRFDFDTSKPDGTPRKLLDSSRLSALGWRPSIDLKSGLVGAYRDFCARIESGDL